MTAVENRLRVARERAAVTRHRDDSPDRDVCHRGHFLDFENTRVKPNGARVCKVCERESERRRGKRR